MKIIGATTGDPAPLVNHNITVERGGTTSVGLGQAVTCNTAHLKGGWSLVHTTVGNYAGFELSLSAVANSTRYLFDIATDAAGTNIIVTNMCCELGAVLNPWRDEFLLNLAPGTTLYMRAQSLAANAVIHASVKGRIRNANSRPMFSQLVVLTSAADLPGTRPTSTNVPLQGTGSTTYETLVTLTESFGALSLHFGFGTNTPVTAQAANFHLATGLAASEVIVDGQRVWITAGTSPFSRSTGLLVEQPFLNGTRIACQFQAGTPGTDGVRVQIHGYK